MPDVSDPDGRDTVTAGGGGLGSHDRLGAEIEGSPRACIRINAMQTPCKLLWNPISFSIAARARSRLSPALNLRARGMRVETLSRPPFLPLLPPSPRDACTRLSMWKFAGANVSASVSCSRRFGRNPATRISRKHENLGNERPASKV